MKREDPASLLADEDHVIGRLTGALRTLEERRSAGLAPPGHVLSYLGALDRTLDEDERCYVATVFAACKTTREELTATLTQRLGVGRGAVIAALRAHLGATLTGAMIAAVSPTVCDYLDHLRANVLTKAAAIR